jgi:hypothetical protein
VQAAGALDSLYAAAAEAPDPGLGDPRSTHSLRLWAPTAASRGAVPARRARPAPRASCRCAWRRPRACGAAALPTRAGATYTYLVDVFVPGAGLLRNRVTDPYALALSADSARTAVVDLADPALEPPGWRTAARPNRVAAATDLVIYELHVRDFSLGDDTVPAPRTAAPTSASPTPDSRGMRHLKQLAQAGLTDVHLLPVFDLATVPEPAARGPRRPRCARCRRDIARAAGAAGAAARHGLLQLGLRPVALHGPRGQLRHRRARPVHAHRGVPPHGAGAARRGAARGHGRGLQPHHRLRPARPSRCSTASCRATTSGSTAKARWSARPAATTPPPSTA